MGAAASAIVGVVLLVAAIVSVVVVSVTQSGGGGTPRTCLQLACPSPTDIVAERLQTMATITWPEPSCKCCKRKENRVYNSARDVKKGQRVEPGSYQGHYWAADDCGHEAKCHFPVTVTVIRCEQLPVPPTGNLTCSHGNLYGSSCTYSCNEGYRVHGPSSVTCERKGKQGRWSAISACTIVTCPKGQVALPEIAHSNVTCDGNMYGHSCDYVCLKKYVIPRSQRTVEYITRTCTASGNWTEGPTPTCRRKIPPTVKSCVKTLNVTTRSLRGTTVKIPKPYFIDSLDQNLTADCGKYMSDTYMFPIGPHVLRCQATDTELDTSAQCIFTITVVPNKCAELDPPDNGALSCSDWLFGILCQMSCQAGYDIIPQGGVFDGRFLCKADGNWSPTGVVPDCSQISNPNRLALPSELFYYVGECGNETVNQQIKENFIKSLNTSATFSFLCTDYKEQCNAEGVSVKCGLKNPPISRRVKRFSLRQFHVPAIIINFNLVLNLPPEIRELNATQYKEVFKKSEDKLYSVFDRVKSEIVSGNISLESTFPELNLTLAQDSFAKGFVSAKCPPGKVAKAGAGTCVSCPVGHYYHTNSASCVACPVGFYQDDEAQLQCTPCPLGTTTALPGAKNDSFCEEIDDCEQNPCSNGGTCIDGRATFTCLCPLSFTGAVCDTHDCIQNKCKNNATCVGFNYYYECNCTDEFSGRYCEHRKVDGGFSEFSEWSLCSQSCGGGVQQRGRECNNPAPAFGGMMCVGNANETRTCNTYPCPVCTPEKLERPIGGTIKCHLVDDNMVCNATCDEGYGFGSPVPENGTYICGPATDWWWPHQSVDNKRAIIPQCTRQASVNKNFVWINSYPQTNCEDLRSVLAVKNKIDMNSNEVTKGLSCMRDASCKKPLVSASCPIRPDRMKRDADVDKSIVVSVVIQSNVTETGLKKLVTEMDHVASEATQLIKNGSLDVAINGTMYGPQENATYGNIDSCPPGAVLAYDGNFCVMCRAGTFFTSNANNNSEVACALCDVDHYQPEEGQTSCIPCPEGGYTEERGATYIDQCLFPTTEGQSTTVVVTEKTTPAGGLSQTEVILIAVLVPVGVVIVIIVIVIIVLKGRHTKSANVTAKGDKPNDSSAEGQEYELLHRTENA